MKYALTLIFITLTAFKILSQDTFSLVAVDSITGEVGSAGASCVDLTNFPGLDADFLGELFPGIGAINTQAWYLESNQINARIRMDLGDSPNQIIDWLVNNDVNNQPELRQYGIAAIDNGLTKSAAHTGTSTDDYKNHITGPGYSIQGNILLGPEVLDQMETNFLNAAGDLSCKLMAALQGANMVGSDSRCSSNGTSSLFAFIKVAQPNDVFGSPSFVLNVKTANGEGIEPIDSLQTLFDDTQSCTSTGFVDKEITKPSFIIYPNPTSDQVYVEIPEKVHSVRLIDEIGNKLLEIKLLDLEKSIKFDVSSIKHGFYILQYLNCNAKVLYSKKLIIQ